MNQAGNPPPHFDKDHLPDTADTRNRRINWVAVAVIVFAILIAIEGALVDSVDKSDFSPNPVASATATPSGVQAAP
jgi:hypothetical protein